uniref:Nudix hydrolase domain-containing protein n=1 Tax=Anopheles braziliensis TaxID=58242 RepID=A0A2M3ZIG2_9DIPT
MRKYTKHWRDSASLIIAARNHGNQRDADGFNYKVLVFKRTEQTSFLPNHIVFPGGAFDPQDDSSEWLSLFRKHSVQHRDLEQLTTVAGPRAYIFQTTQDDTLDRNISLRLCALRESFEELGVLLVANRPEQSMNGFSRAEYQFEIDRWQKEVHDGQTDFLQLYSKLDVLPDMWGLYEWSVWITPTQFRKKRFETAFFLAALNEQVPVHPEQHEVAEYMWSSPKQLIEEHDKGDLWLAPPQAYELHRLSYVDDIDALVRFARRRKYHGTTAFCPVGFNAADGYIGVLPGDDFYPPNFNFISENEQMDHYVDMSLDELRALAQNVHRVEHRGMHSQTYLHNGPPLDKHLHVLGKNEGTLRAKL